MAARKATITRLVPPVSIGRDATLDGVLRHAGVPRRFLDRSLATFDPHPGVGAAFREAEKLADPSCSTSAAFFGPPGTGKTHLAVGTVRGRAEAWLARFPTEIVNDGPEGLVARPPFHSRFASAPQLLDDLRYSIEYHEPDPLQAIRDVPLLVLDDVGREKTSDWVLDRFFVLLDHRYRTELPVVFTSNYTPDELVSRGYDAIVSRLSEMGPLVFLTGRDRRVAA